MLAIELGIGSPDRFGYQATNQSTAAVMMPSANRRLSRARRTRYAGIARTTRPIKASSSALTVSVNIGSPLKIRGTTTTIAMIAISVRYGAASTGMRTPATRSGSVRPPAR